MKKIIKNIDKILLLIDKKNRFSLVLINLFFILNAIFQFLFIFSFYLLIQSFSDPDAIMNNDLIVYLNKFLNLEINTKNLNYYFVIVFFLVVIFSNIIFIISNFLKFNFSFGLLTKLRSKLYNFFLSQNFVNFIKKNSASYINVILSDCERFSMQIIGNCLNILMALISLIFVLAPVSIINFKITLFSFISISILFLITSSYLKPSLKRFGFQIKEFSKNRFEILNDSFRNFNEIKLENLSNFFKQKYLDKESQINLISKKLSIINHSSKPIIEILLIIVFFILYKFLLQTNSMLSEYFDLIAVIIVTLYKLIPSVNSIYQSINEINYHKIVIKGLLGILKKNESSKKINSSVPKFIKQVTLKNVSFNYKQLDSFLINKINLTLKKNTITGIKGISGTGKTTILNIISGLLKHKSGSIYINEKKTDIFNNPNWFKKISYVSQNVNIFNDTIYNNISYNFHDSLFISNKKKIQNILKDLNLNEFIKKNKKLDELGKNISGGQLQRISISRALFKNSEIIIFDEPTRNLDIINEKRLINIISKLKKNKIIIFISHNQKNLNICDKIIKLNKTN